MYKLSIPIMSETVNKENRERYVQLCREAGAPRVFLCNGSILEPIPASLGENVRYFKSQGFEVGIWTDTIGHGFVLDHVQTGGDIPTFTQIVDIQGNERPHANCPMDLKFRTHIAKHIAKLAKTGADVVQLDDDFRMSQHGPELCCACSNHLARIGEILGEEITLEQLRPFVLTGKANKYRDAWLQAQQEGLMEMAKAIRAEVDKKTPHVTVCTCVALAPWNPDNVDVAALTRILAGQNRPILRLTGAPYWACKPRRRYPLVGTFEVARMLAAFVEGEDFDLMSEGDVYPRPRYTCPASYLELYDAVTRADGGYTGILKYMFDYVAGPELELGYLRAHQENEPFLHTVSALFKGGANAGVRVIARPHTMKNADLDLTGLDPNTPRPIDGFMLGSCGIPTVYRGKGSCNSVFGENARAHDLSLLGEGTMLDAVSAVILTERGVDVGLESLGTLSPKTVSFLRTQDPAYKSCITDGKARILSAPLKPTATPLLFSTTPTGDYPIAYRYENAAGQRFLVFLFDSSSIYSETHVGISGLLKNYATQQALTETLPWLARRPLPAYCTGNPELYLMCQKEESAATVALFNCFADAIPQATVYLDEAYSRIECFNCTATVEGNKVTLTGKLHAFEAAAFRVFR